MSYEGSYDEDTKTVPKNNNSDDYCNIASDFVGEEEEKKEENLLES